MTQTSHPWIVVELTATHADVPVCTASLRIYLHAVPITMYHRISDLDVSVPSKIVPTADADARLPEAAHLDVIDTNVVQRHITTQVRIKCYAVVSVSSDSRAGEIDVLDYEAGAIVGG